MMDGVFRGFEGKRQQHDCDSDSRHPAPTTDRLMLHNTLAGGKVAHLRPEKNVGSLSVTRQRIDSQQRDHLREPLFWWLASEGERRRRGVLRPWARRRLQGGVMPRSPWLSTVTQLRAALRAERRDYFRRGKKTGPTSAHVPQRPSTLRTNRVSSSRITSLARSRVCLTRQSKHHAPGRAFSTSRTVVDTTRRYWTTVGTSGIRPWSTGGAWRLADTRRRGTTHLRIVRQADPAN